MSQFETIKLDIADDVATLTLNRPDRLNACPPEMADEIFIATRQLGGARALLVVGEGRAFCSGADLAASSQSAITGGDRSFVSLSKHYNPMIKALCTLPIPVISAVTGPAAGVGCSLALAADFVIVGKGGYFLQAFVNIGLVPDGGSSWMLPRLVGLAHANRMMMLGERIYGEEAERIGLVYKCVEDDAVMTEARSLAARLAKGPTVALGRMKHNIRAGLDSDFSTTLHIEAEGQKIAGDSDDAHEGMTAFLEKRETQFKGA